jgi:sporulation protein YlmC with PRC-barrel domain
MSSPDFHDPALDNQSDQGRTVIDDHGTKVGTVTDVVFDDATNEATWAIVKTGLTGGEHYVPLAGAYRADDGGLVIAFSKRLVKASPKAGREHVLTASDEEMVRNHYGLVA